MDKDGQADTFLTEEELAERWRGQVTRGTLRNWRTQGRGPPFLKAGRAVLYPRSRLLAWEAGNLMAWSDPAVVG